MRTNRRLILQDDDDDDDDDDMFTQVCPLKEENSTLRPRHVKNSVCTPRHLILDIQDVVHMSSF